MQNLAVRGSGRISLTSEQSLILDQAPDQTTRWRAFAGCAKTTTGVEYAHQWKRPSLYLAFNAAIAADAKGRFPDHVTTKTAHGYAFTALNVQKHSDRLVARLRNDHLDPFRAKLVGYGNLGPPQMRRAFLSSFNAWLISDSPEMSLEHLHGVPLVMRQYLLEDFKSIAEQLLDFRANGLPYTHDVYLKAFAREQTISERFDYMFIDEAQDLNPVLIGIVRRAVMPSIIVGDDYQSIYSFRGAINAMSAFDGPIYSLSQSFRFGPATAAVANWILRQTFTPPQLPVAGWRERETKVLEYTGVIRSPTTVLARTNMRIIKSLITTKAKFHYVGRIEEVLRQIMAAYALRFGLDRREFPFDPLVASFRTWSDLCEEAEYGDDPELPRLVEIIETYTTGIPEIVQDLQARSLPDDKNAPLVVSTAHKAKGREWPTVVLLDDFPTIADLDQMVRAKKMDPLDYDQELHLLYVAVTRAMSTLYLSPATYNEVAAATGLTGHH